MEGLVTKVELQLNHIGFLMNGALMDAWVTLITT
jgi:hypothetical protein